MAIYLSNRMSSVQPAVIPQVAELIRQNPDTISLGQGVVFYPPPPTSLASINKFGSTSKEHHYQSANGLPEFIDAISLKLETENNIKIDEGSTVMVTAGSNMAFYYSLLAIADPGDEIIINTPYYFNHEMAISMANCKAVLVPTDKQYQLDIGALEDAITCQTRAIVTISPNNPTGAVYPTQTLKQVNELCHQEKIYHISDEAYEHFTFDNAKHVSPGSFAQSNKHTISLFSFSKSYGLASWRVGYLVAPSHMKSALEKAQDTVLICPSVISQHAALGALHAGPSYCHSHQKALSESRSICLQHLNDLGKRVSTPKTSGAFYILSKIDTDLTAIQLVEKLINKHNVAAIPGEAFGLHDGCYIRIAFGALSKDILKIGIDRLIRGLEIIIS